MISPHEHPRFDTAASKQCDMVLKVLHINICVHIREIIGSGGRRLRDQTTNSKKHVYGGMFEIKLLKLQWL